MTGDGYRAILSAPWYLNYIDYGSDWTQYYKVDPTDFGGKDDNFKLVVGGEVRHIYLWLPDIRGAGVGGWGWWG